MPMTWIWRILLPTTLLVGGCAIAGPASISNGRMVYNEVINYTNDQQILNMIVRERYDQTFGMLSVASVTANVKVRANAGAQFRAGASARDVEGNLVPLSAGVAYEENPTISYIPLQGEAVLRRMASPITIEQAFLVRKAAIDSKVAVRELYRSINSLQNPVGSRPSPEFERFTDVGARLIQAEVMFFGRAAGFEGAGPEYFISLHDYGPEHADDVREFLDTLGIKGKTVDGPEILIPLRKSVGKATTDAINVELRSALDWIRHAGSMVDVPAPHLEAGIVEPSRWERPEKDRFITIRSSKKRPKNALVEISFRGWWFYIDAADTRSKRSFKLTRFLIGLRLNEQSAERQIPVLTVPVG
jgi:hypothetical protein